MRGFVPTPEAVVDLMVDKLFRTRRPDAQTLVLDPGCGRGAFIDGMIRWCARNDAPVPRILGVELEPEHVRYCKSRFSGYTSVTIVRADFLDSVLPEVDAVIGNPPYVPITSLNEAEKRYYRGEFRTAHGRFDLYSLFFERALRLLRTGGRLVFITPEKFLYVESSRALRGLMSGNAVEELQFIDESTFPGLVTYPLITTLEKGAPERATRVMDRDGESQLVVLHRRELSWQPLLRGYQEHDAECTLAQVARRVSCGVATGADSVFVHRTADLPRELERFARPTISGRELRFGSTLCSAHSLLLPYSADGQLLREEELGALLGYLTYPSRFETLMRRTCTVRKPWYAFHESPPLLELLRPKILCKDIGPRPAFVLDPIGAIVPRHSVYYIVPDDSTDTAALLDYLNSEAASGWLEKHCQRAANGFLRLQSSVLKRLPVPRSVLLPVVVARRERSA